MKKKTKTQHCTDMDMNNPNYKIDVLCFDNGIKTRICNVLIWFWILLPQLICVPPDVLEIIIFSTEGYQIFIFIVLVNEKLDTRSKKNNLPYLLLDILLCNIQQAINLAVISYLLQKTSRTTSILLPLIFDLSLSFVSVINSAAPSSAKIMPR